MFKVLKKLNFKEALLIVFSVALIVGQVYLDLKLPDYMSEITTLIQTGGKIGDILKNGGLMLACALSSGLLAVVVSYIAAFVSANVSKRLRTQLYNKVATFSPTEMHKFSTASLITRTTNDISQIQQTLSMGLQVIIKAPILAVWAICKIVTKSWQWSLATAISVVILLIMISIILALCVPKFKIVQKQTDDLNKVTTENLTGLRVVKAFNAEDFVEGKFNGVNANLTNTNLFTSYSLSFLMPIMNLVMNGLAVAIYVIGAYLINAQAMVAQKMALFSDMVVFYSYAMQVISAFIMLVMIFMNLPRAQVCARRVNEVLITETAISDGTGVVPTEVGTVKFENVCFNYDDAKEPVLKDINFEAQKGQMVAIIGATGSGKSTLIKLIPRLYDATSGNVLVDGKNVKDYKLDDLYSRIGYISQRTVLFSGTVASNVTMGNKNGQKVSEDELDNAIINSQSSRFVENMEGGKNAQISQGGSNISGGQKQRLSIARALARKPEILIFDDSFSALDYQTDKNLRTTLKTKLSGVTSIIVAQRIGTIKNCDKILVVDDGKIVGSGTHKELMKNCETYKQIALSQLSKEELK